MVQTWPSLLHTTSAQLIKQHTHFGKRRKARTVISMITEWLLLKSHLTLIVWIFVPVISISQMLFHGTYFDIVMWLFNTPLPNNRWYAGYAYLSQYRSTTGAPLKSLYVTFNPSAAIDTQQTPSSSYADQSRGTIWYLPGCLVELYLNLTQAREIYKMIPTWFYKESYRAFSVLIIIVRCTTLVIKYGSCSLVLSFLRFKYP